MIFNFRKRERKIEAQDKVIQEVKRQHTRQVNKDIKAIQQLNEILDNGVTLEIKNAIRGNHG